MAQYLGVRGLSTSPAARQIIHASLAAVTLAIAALSSAKSSAQDCMSNARTQIEINTCALQIYRDAERHLADTYRKLRGKLGADDAVRLDEAERAWGAYRDTECSFETSGTEGGSIHATFVASCLTEKTRLRLRELTRVLECDAHDPGCAHAPP
jgi:uncharacterized protein YecT (DUF1311 family)